MRRLGTMGKTIIVSSHILPELADVCNKVGIIDAGVLKKNALVSDVIKEVRSQLVMIVEPSKAEDYDRTGKLLETIETVETVESAANRFRVRLQKGQEDPSILLTTCISGNCSKAFRRGRDQS